MKVVIVAMPGVGNLGDDLISVLLVHKILDQYPRAEVGVLHYPGTNDVPYPAGGRVRLLPYPQLSSPSGFYRRYRQVRDFIAGADYVLIGGGGLIQDTHTRYTIHRYFQYAFNYPVRRAKVALVGVGVGPIRLGASAKYFASVLGRCSVVQVRDRDSFRYLAGTNVPVEVDTDVVVGSDLSVVGLRAAESRDPALGCSIRPWPSLDFFRVARLIAGVCRRHGLTCRLFVFEYESWNTEEYDYALRLKKYLEDQQISTRVYCYAKDDWGTFRRAFAGVSRAIAVRFHANILWQKLGVAVLPIAYAPKVKSLYEEKGGRVLSIDNLEVTPSVDGLFQRIDLDEQYRLPDLESLELAEASLRQQAMVKYTTLLHTVSTLQQGLRKRVKGVFG